MKDYTRLSEICEEAWSLIVATYVNAEKPKKKSGAIKKVAKATFSEGMLRPILKLESWQPEHTRISPKQPLRGVSVATLAQGRSREVLLGALSRFSICPRSW